MKAKRILAVILAAVIALTLFGCSAKSDKAPTKVSESTTETTTKPVPVNNPFTGEDDFSSKAVGVRPVAIVVENLSPARPQWGITSPDIIVEGEVEGGISRMLWLYADCNSVPEKVGPLRSARPSYVKFSKLFDAVFIHWGGSHSKGDYVGGYETIKKEKVDDIDGMNGGKLFGRDTTRRVSSEHRGILNGKNIASTIKSKKYRTTINESNFTRFTFNDDIKDAGTESASGVNVTFSNRTDTRKFTYSTSDKKYHTNDWKTDVKFQNVIVLMAKSTYITTPYKGSTTTYLNYTLSEGNGYYASNGKIAPIKWSAKDGQLNLTDAEGKTLALNKGKSYIGLASSNNSGKVSYK